MTKMTNVKAIDFVLTNCSNLPEDVVAKLSAMNVSFDKKSGAERKPTPTQVENKGHNEAILDALASGEEMTITDLMKAVPELG